MKNQQAKDNNTADWTNTLNKLFDFFASMRTDQLEEWEECIGILKHDYGSMPAFDKLGAEDCSSFFHIVQEYMSDAKSSVLDKDALEFNSDFKVGEVVRVEFDGKCFYGEIEGSAFVYDGDMHDRDIYVPIKHNGNQPISDISKAYIRD